MAKTPGIKYTKDAKGNNRYVTFDLKQHGETLRPMLESLGAVERVVFDEDFEKGLTIQEAIEYTTNLIKAARNGTL